MEHRGYLDIDVLVEFPVKSSVPGVFCGIIPS